MKIVLGQDRAIVDWAARKLKFPEDESFGPCVAMAVTDNDGVGLAGVIFSGYRPMYKSIEVTCVAESPRWATRGVIDALLTYVFDQLKCERLQVTIPIDNTRAQRFCRGIGFVREGTARLGFGDRHAIVMSMLRADRAKLFRRKKDHGQIGTQSARAA